MKHSFRSSTSLVLLYAAVCLPPPAPVVLESFPFHLPLTADEWTKEVSLGLDSDVALGAAAAFLMDVERPYGATLEVGPWTAGHRHAEYRYVKKFPNSSGTLRGLYRTENMFPAGTVVTASFYKGTKNLGTQDFYLDPVSAWSYFQIPLRFSPPGTDSVGLGLGVAQRNLGKAFFANLSFSKAEGWPLRACMDPPQLTRTKSQAKFQSSGFFRVQNIQGTWWLVTPHGRPVYSTGVATSAADAASSTADQYALYRQLGFNSISTDIGFEGWAAGNTLHPTEALWMFQTLNTSQWAQRQSGAFDRLQTAKGEISTVPGQGAEHSFPDPFDPKFANFYRGSVRVVAQFLKDTPWFVGYYADSGLGFAELPRRVWSNYAGQAFIHFLLVKYGMIGGLNQLWGTTFSSFEALAEKKPDPESGGAAMKRDFALFAREIVKRYVLLTGNIIREEDPNHLIFSNRFTSGPELLEALPYLDLFTGFDALALDLPIENVQAGMTLAQRGQLELLYRATAKPIVIASTTLAARDSGYYDNAGSLDRTFWNSVPDQKARATQVAHFLTDLYNTPYVIGAHWSSYRDGVAGGPSANIGLVRRSGARYQELTDVLTVLNHQLYEAPLKASTPLAGVPPFTRIPVSTEGSWQSKSKIYPGRVSK